MKLSDNLSITTLSWVCFIFELQEERAAYASAVHES